MRSVLPDVDVKVGAIPAGHLTAAGHVTLCAVPFPVMKIETLQQTPDSGTLENVIVLMPEVRVTAKTVPRLKSSVSVEDDIVAVTSFSLGA